MRFEARIPLKGNQRFKDKAIRDAIARFEETGESVHSPNGTLCAHILNHCVANGIDFTLRHIGRGGFHITKGV